MMSKPTRAQSDFSRTILDKHLNTWFYP